MMELKKVIEYLQKLSRICIEKRESFLQDDILSVTVEYYDYTQFMLNDKKLKTERDKVPTIPDITKPEWWVNEKGEHPIHMHLITVKDIENGIWKPSKKKRDGYED